MVMLDDIILIMLYMTVDLILTGVMYVMRELAISTLATLQLARAVFFLRL